MSMNNIPAIRARSGALNVFLVAAWFGLVTGLLEGVGFLTAQKFGRLMHVWLEITWISPLFDLLLFGVLGLILSGISRLLPRLPVILASLFLFIFLAALDLLTLMLVHRVHQLALTLLAIGLAVELTRRVAKYEKAALRFFRRSLPSVAVLVLLTIVGVQGGQWLRTHEKISNLPKPHTNEPNVLLIVIDTLRADHFSCYGYERLTSPNIDLIAQQGVLFKYAFATSSYTLPSHASLLTGHYTEEHGVEWDTSKQLFTSPHLTLAEALYSRGYRTAAFSANTLWFTREQGFGRGFIRFEDFFHSFTDMALRTVYGRALEKYVLQRFGLEDIPARKRASDVNRSLFKWIRRDRERPFFAVLNYMDTHDPYLPPLTYRNKFSTVENPGGILNCRIGRCDPKMTTEQLQGEIDAYDGAIAYLDDHIDRLFTELKKLNLSHNTLVVITSDHGEAFGEHDLLLHDNSLYWEVIHVPLIFWLPNRIAAGVRVDQPVTNAALPATIMEIIGDDSQSLFPGLPLNRLWSKPETEPEWLNPLAEMRHKPWTLKKYPVAHGTLRSIITPRFHYIINKKTGTEIYDWKNDPSEVYNLAKQKKTEAVSDRPWRILRTGK
jgi:arylsulfatase A-like enzyme